MLKLQAEKAARKMMMSEYRHHRYEDELRVSGTLFHLERSDFLSYMNSLSIDNVTHSYIDVLGPNRMRSLKNTLICYITPLCRIAIDMGVDSEFSFALSDFYISYLEGLEKEADVSELFRHVTMHYYDLVQAAAVLHYTKQITYAIRFIQRKLYSSCTVLEVAEYVGLERHYFASLFKKQVGISPSRYILKCKLEEGRRVLMYTDSKVSDVAGALCFFDTAHFCRSFKQEFGTAPLKQINNTENKRFG